MKTVDVEKIDLKKDSLIVDVRETCTFLTHVAMHSESSPEFGGVGGDLAARLALLREMCGQLGLTSVPLETREGGFSGEKLLLGDFLGLLVRACEDGVIEAAHLDMIEDLHALERGLRLDEDERDNAALDLGEFVDALEGRRLFEFLFVDPQRAELLRVDEEAWDGASEVLLDHARAGMSEETALWVVKKHMREDVEASDAELALAVRACLLDLDPVCAPEDYAMLSYIEEALRGVEDEGQRVRMKEVAGRPENVHRMQEAFDEAGFGEEGRALIRASMELFAREWLNHRGIAWR